MNYNFLCKYKRISPSIGVPVYVKDEAIEKHSFPREHRGGIIHEDMSFVTKAGEKFYAFKVKHRNGIFTWSADDLVEIGGLKIEVDETDES
jgi:hypothetical protein